MKFVITDEQYIGDAVKAFERKLREKLGLHDIDSDEAAHAAGYELINNKVIIVEVIDD